MAEDTRLSKNGTFLHIGKVKNFRAAISDAIGDTMNSLKSIFPMPPGEQQQSSSS